MRSLAITILCCLAYFSYGQLVLEKLPDQLIGREGSFENVVLSDYVSVESFFEVEFLAPETLDVRPDWDVNGADFQFEMNVTATVKSKGISAVGDSHLLAVMASDGSLRSVGSGIKVENDWVYFLTVYSNTNAENLQFVLFDDSISQIIKGNKSIVFESNKVLGEPDDPYLIEFNNIRFDLQGDALSFFIEDINFIGDENLLITARSLADPVDFQIDTLTLTVSDDYTPQLNGIPNQISNFGDEFTSFDLDDYTQLQDSDPVSFSFSGNNELQVSIDNENLVIISKPDQWSGSETITFTVTDQSDNGFLSSISVNFIGKPQDQAPEIISISDRTTGIGGFFEPILLSDFVVASNPEAIKWSFQFLTDSIVSSPSWTVNENEFQFDMSMTAKVNALGKPLSGLNHKLVAYSSSEDKIVGVTEAIQVNEDWFFFLTINSNTDNDSIYFKVYDDVSKRILPTESYVFFQANEVLGDPLEPYEIDAGYLFPMIKESQLSFSLRQATWDGVETLRLIATDTSTTDQLFASDTINFEVLNLLPPVLDSIPNQAIEEGTNFQSIDIANYLRNVAFSEVSALIVGADTLNPTLNGSVISFSIQNEDYFGVETLIIKVTSLTNNDLTDELEVKLTVNNVNDAPIISSEFNPNASISTLYQYNLITSDVDFDPLSISVIGLPSWLFFVPNSGGAILLGIPSEDDAGEYNFTIEVSDGQKIIIQNIKIIVSSASINEIANQSIDEGGVFSEIDLDDYMTIIGSLNTSWEVVQGVNLIVDLNAENVLSVQTPNADWFGVEIITIRLLNESTGAELDEVQVKYEVLNINDAPVITTTPPGNPSIGNLYSYNLVAVDVDLDALTFNSDNLPLWLTFTTNSNGAVINGVPTKEDAGENSYSVTVSDGYVDVTQQIDIVISLAQIDEINDQIIDEGGAFNTIDLDDYLITHGNITTTWSVSDGINLGITLDAENMLSVTVPNSDWFGNEEVKIQLLDQVNSSVLDEVVVQYKVLNINDAPVITTTPPGNPSVGSLYSYYFLATDVDLDELTITATDLPGWLTLIPNTNGAVINGVPSEQDGGEYSFSIEVSDGQETTQQQVEFVISLARISTIGNQIINEGDAFASIDLDDFLVIYGSIDTKWNVSLGIDLTTSLDSDNILSVETPNEDWYGEETITIQLLDQSNDDLLDEVNLEFKVQNVNDIPQFLSNPSLEIDSEEQLNVKTLVSDVDDDKVTFSLVGAPDWITIFTEVDGFTLFGQPERVASTFDFEVVANDGVAESTLTVQITVSVVLSIDDANSIISIFPNPTVSELKIESEELVSTILIFDKSGKQVLRIHKDVRHIDVSSLNQGVYMLLINDSHYLKFIKQ